MKPCITMDGKIGMAFEDSDFAAMTGWDWLVAVGVTLLIGLVLWWWAGRKL